MVRPPLPGRGGALGRRPRGVGGVGADRRASPRCDARHLRGHAGPRLRRPVDRRPRPSRWRHPARQLHPHRRRRDATPDTGGVAMRTAPPPGGLACRAPSSGGSRRRARGVSERRTPRSRGRPGSGTSSPATRGTWKPLAGTSWRTPSARRAGRRGAETPQRGVSTTTTCGPHRDIERRTAPPPGNASYSGAVASVAIDTRMSRADAADATAASPAIVASRSA